MDTSQPNIRLRGYAALAVCLLLGLWLRLPFIGEGLPYFYNEDEGHHFNRTVDMVKNGTFDPRYFHKPSLHFYLRMPVVAASFLWTVKQGNIRSIKEIQTRDPYGLAGYAFTASHPGIVKWNRAFTLLLSLLLLFFTFKLTFEVTGSTLAASIATALVTVSPELVRQSTVIGVDMLMSLTCLVSVYLAILLHKKFTLSGLIGLGLICGLSVSSKYNAFLVAALPLLVIALTHRVTSINLLVAVVTPILGFIIGTPYSLVSIPLFLDQMAYEAWHYAVAGHEGHMAKPGLEQAIFYLNWLRIDAVGVAAWVLAGLGAIAILFKGKKGVLLFLFFPVAYFLFMISQKANFTRNMLCIIPFIAACAGYFIYLLVSKFESRRSFQLVVLVVFTLVLLQSPSLKALTVREQALTDADSREKALSWLTANEEPLTDTAIAGELQFPPSLLARPGATRINQTLVNPLDLYLSGFSRLVRGGFTPIPDELADLLKIDSIFEGASARQRVVRNPQVNIYSFRESPELQTLAFARAKTENFPSSSGAVEVNRSGISNPGKLSCASDSVNALAPEDHCWLQRRFSFFKLENIGDLKALSASDGTLSLSFTTMSPWPDQKVQITSDQGEIWAELPPLIQGEWASFTFKAPYEKLKVLGGIWFSLSEVHSPKSQGLSEDDRRLGIAIKDLKIVN